MFTGPQRAKHHYAFLNLDAWRADRGRMFQGAASSSSCDCQFAFGNHRVRESHSVGQCAFFLR